MGFRRITAGLAGLATCTVAMAQGSINFDSIPVIEQQPIFTVDLNPVLIGFLRSAAEAADPDAPDLFAGLRSIKLRVYPVSESGREFSTFIQRVAGQLEGQGWQSVASVQGEGSNARFLVQMTEEMVNGMTVMVLEGDEAIFINIDGSISAADLGRLMEQWDIPMEAIGAMTIPTTPAPSPAAAVPDGN